MSKHSNTGKQFKIYQEGNKKIIERLSYPRFKGVVSFSGTISDIEEVELLDETIDPSVIAKAMREAGEYLINHSK
jgi:hypothetical protein